MEKKELANIITDELLPFRYKKKGNVWILKEDEITKVINLQKSKFGNKFYINYGYIINSIPLDNLTMHIFMGLGSLDDAENTKILEFLDLDFNISDSGRSKELRSIIQSQVLNNQEKVNNKDDLLQFLKSRPHLNDVPLVVKEYFRLP